jgi:hypothetical protein
VQLGKAASDLCALHDCAHQALLVDLAENEAERAHFVAWSSILAAFGVSSVGGIEAAFRLTCRSA